MSVPHLVPYCAAKFAAVGLSEGLRAELSPHGISVTTVVPGLMRTGSHLQALFKSRHREEFAWFGLGASLPVISMDAERAARRIVEAIAIRRAEIVLTPQARALVRIHGVAPATTARALTLVARMLPSPDGVGVERRTGEESRGEIAVPSDHPRGSRGRGLAATRRLRHGFSPASNPERSRAPLGARRVLHGRSHSGLPRRRRGKAPRRSRFTTGAECPARRFSPLAASSLRAPMVVRGRLPLDEGKRREVLTTIVASLERALAATADTARSQAEVRDELAGIKAVGQDETVVIHIRVGRSRLEVDVFPESESAAGEGDVEFRTWLLQRLRAEGLSQESAARRIGISTRTVGRWARGQTQPRMRDLSRVREALGELPSF